MTFCPEWLSGNQNLVTSNPLYLWFYLTVSVRFALHKTTTDSNVLKFMNGM